MFQRKGTGKQREAAADEGRDRPVRVLLVDDEQDLVDFLAQRLQRRGFAVTAVTSGADALAAAVRQRFDVAVIDLKMPQMDGIEVLKRLKEEQPFLEAIMLTGHGSHDSALAAGRLHASRYLIKPYDFDDLLARLQEAYEAKAAALRERYQDELARLIGGPGATPRDIIEASEKLRRKYEQD